MCLPLRKINLLNLKYRYYFADLTLYHDREHDHLRIVRVSIVKISFSIPHRKTNIIRQTSSQDLGLGGGKTYTFDK